MELVRKKKSKYWWYDFTVRGQRYRGSTEETNENRAKKIASLKLAAALEGSDPLPKKAPALRDFAQRFLDWVDEAQLEEKTKTYYRGGWRLLSLTSITGMRLDAISNDHVEMLTFPGAAANRNCAIRTLSRMLHRAEDWNVIRRAPRLKLAKEYERSLRLDDEREKKLLAGAAVCNWREKALALFSDILILARGTGLRDERELFRIRIEDLDFGRKLIFVPDSKTESGRREVPMSDRVTEALLKRRSDRKQGWLFASKRSKSGHLTTIAGHFRQARRKAGLPEQLVLYCGRHDFGTRLYNETKNLKLVMTVMGQKDVKSAMRYQHPDLEIARAALNGNGAVRAPGD